MTYKYFCRFEIFSYIFFVLRRWISAALEKLMLDNLIKVWKKKFWKYVTIVFNNICRNIIFLDQFWRIWKFDLIQNILSAHLLKRVKTRWTSIFFIFNILGCYGKFLMEFTTGFLSKWNSVGHLMWMFSTILFKWFSKIFYQISFCSDYFIILNKDKIFIIWELYL